VGIRGNRCGRQDAVLPAGGWELIGATEVRSNDEDIEFEDARAFLSLGDGYIVLGVYDTRQATEACAWPPTSTRLHHIAFEVATAAELAPLPTDPRVWYRTGFATS